ncbi:MAG: EVE domain-containing protein [Gammaproteobacteria bacterium]|nr:MAG: EVE domain-containing protein [Gammaproteobacteria bacterium]
MRYWLMKSEPEVFGIEHLKQRRIEPWDGVRNYQARNFLRAMRVGDRAFFYHSNCPAPGITGMMEIVKSAYPDATQFDPTSPYFDPRSDPQNPRWQRVDVRFVRDLKRLVSLREIKNYPELRDLPLVQRGSRLSVMPLTERQWRFILSVE